MTGVIKVSRKNQERMLQWFVRNYEKRHMLKKRGQDEWEDRGLGG